MASARVGAVLVVLALCGAPRPARAQSSFELDGYLKSLLIGSRSVVDDRGFAFDVSRLRLQGSWIRGRWHAETWIDSELFVTVPTVAETAYVGIAPSDPLVDLDWGRSLIVEEDLFVRAAQRVYRASLSWYGRRATVTAGRQRVSWGTGFVWTPTDVLHPVRPAAFERDEKPAVDAVQVSVSLGALSAAEAVYAPARRSSDHRVAGRLRGNVGEYDWTLLGGRFADEWIFGGDFAGYVRDAGLRGEVAFTRERDDAWSTRAVVNGDYTFAGGWYAFVEGHYNGPGAARPSEYDLRALVDGRVLNLARWYAATGITYLASPLVTGTLYVVHNLDDGSGLVGPGVTWSVSQDAELTAGFYIFHGPAASEYGARRDAAIVSYSTFF